MTEGDFSHLRYVDTIPRNQRIRRLLWELVWLLLFRPTPRWFFNAWRVFLLRCFGATIGPGSRVLPTCRVWAPWNLTLGSYSVLGDDVDCYAMNSIIIGSKVAISQRAFLCGGSHDIESLRRPLITGPICIHDHAWVCAEAFVGPNITIGEGAIIAARAAVVRDVPEWVVVGGNPANVIKQRTIRDSSSQGDD